MTDLGYDLGALDAFTGQLTRIKQGLESSHSVIDSFDSDYGDGRVRDAMHAFEKRWRDGRGHVENTAGVLSSMVSEAVKAYTKVDEDLAKQLRDGTKAPQ
ncbi:DUF6507 family protein [Streptomyces fildesensis]|uniref:DUF6507 family protein n=1 Tax=Streptomyces fildesensis TaxID=375757 RepID=A0ABW8CHB5_9ACTN